MIRFLSKFAIRQRTTLQNSDKKQYKKWGKITPLRWSKITPRGVILLHFQFFYSFRMKFKLSVMLLILLITDCQLECHSEPVEL